MDAILNRGFAWQGSHLYVHKFATSLDFLFCTALHGEKTKQNKTKQKWHQQKAKYTSLGPMGRFTMYSPEHNTLSLNISTCTMPWCKPLPPLCNFARWSSIYSIFLEKHSHRRSRAHHKGVEKYICYCFGDECCPKWDFKINHWVNDAAPVHISYGLRIR